MAATKITDLAAITTIATEDWMVTVDISDTTMGSAGTNTKITWGNLMAAPGVIGGTTPAVGTFTTLNVTEVRIGSNQLSLTQSSFAIVCSNNWKVNGVSAMGGAAISGTTTLGVIPTAIGNIGIFLSPFSAGQTADLIKTQNASASPKFAVVAGGTPLSEDSAQGMVFKSSNGHYWRQTIDDAGLVVIADLGTDRPTS